MKDYKTTVFGIIGAIGIAILAEYEHNDPRWLKYLGSICNGIGIVGMGYMASDKKKEDFFK